MRHLTLLAVLLLTFAAALTLHAAERRRPNIVLIMADDMGYECLRANGGTSYETPRLDALAKRGVRFTHCYSQPLCAPSRTKIMTGLYNCKNYKGFHALPQDDPTFGNLLQQAGYATGIVGKWQLGKDRALIPKFGFDEHCLWWLEQKSDRYNNLGLLIENGKDRPGGKGEYGPDVVSGFAMDFMTRHQKRPFFLYYPMMLPHDPFEATPLSKPHKKNREQQHQRDMVHYVDTIVGRIDDHLEKLGIRDNTILIFTTDNGSHKTVTAELDGRTVTGGKGIMTDAGTRVPLVVSWPGTAKAGTVCDDLVDFSDFLPTLLEAGGVRPPAKLDLDGRSFLPQVRGERGTPREWAYCWFGRVGAWARTQRYKLYGDGLFFDITQDPEELTPLTGTLTKPAMAARTLLEGVHKQYGSAGLTSRKHPSARGQKRKAKKAKNKK